MIALVGVLLEAAGKGLAKGLEKSLEKAAEKKIEKCCSTKSKKAVTNAAVAGKAGRYRRTIKLKNGTSYTGDWVDGVGPDGKGALNYPDGSRYIGEAKNGCRHGKGVFIKKNGDRYEGSFERDFYDGWGKLAAASGNVYEGMFVKGKYNGQGKMTFKHGDVYIGPFKDNWIEGRGILHKGAGPELRYEGEFVHGKRNGSGISFNRDGSMFIGVFKDGQKIDGRIVCEDGSKQPAGTPLGLDSGLSPITSQLSTLSIDADADEPMLDEQLTDSSSLQSTAMQDAAVQRLIGSAYVTLSSLERQVLASLSLFKGPMPLTIVNKIVMAVANEFNGDAQPDISTNDSEDSLTTGDESQGSSGSALHPILAKLFDIGVVIVSEPSKDGNMDSSESAGAILAWALPSVHSYAEELMDDDWSQGCEIGTPALISAALEELQAMFKSSKGKEYEIVRTASTQSETWLSIVQTACKSADPFMLPRLLSAAKFLVNHFWMVSEEVYMDCRHWVEANSSLKNSFSFGVVANYVAASSLSRLELRVGIQLAEEQLAFGESVQINDDNADDLKDNTDLSMQDWIDSYCTMLAAYLTIQSMDGGAVSGSSKYTKLQHALDLCHSLPAYERCSLVAALSSAGRTIVSQKLGEAKAVEQLRVAVEAVQSCGSSLVAAITEATLLFAEKRRDNLPQVASRLKEIGQYVASYGLIRGKISCLIMEAQVHDSMGALGKALMVASQASELAKERSMHASSASLALWQVGLFTRLGDMDSASSFFREVSDIYLNSGSLLLRLKIVAKKIMSKDLRGNSSLADLCDELRSGLDQMDSSEGRSYLLRSLGYGELWQGHHEEAASAAEESIVIARKLKSTGDIGFGYMLHSAVLSAQQHKDFAVARAKEAADIAAKEEFVTPTILSLHVRALVRLASLQSEEASLQTYQEAEQLISRGRENAPDLVLVLYESMAKKAKQAKRLADAIQYVQICREVINGTVNSMANQRLTEFEASCRKASGENTAAELLYKEAAEIATNLSLKGPTGRCLEERGECLITLGKFGEAVHELERAYPLLLEAGLKKTADVAGKYIAVAYEKGGNKGAACKAWEKAVISAQELKLSDSIISSRKTALARVQKAVGISSQSMEDTSKMEKTVSPSTKAVAVPIARAPARSIFKIKKQSDFLQQWRDRVLVIDGSTISIGENENDKDMKRYDGKGVKVLADDKSKCRFFLEFSDCKRYRFEASTESQAAGICKLLREVANR